MPRGRPKGSKNKPKTSDKFTKESDIEVSQEYQFVPGQPMISNFNPFTKSLQDRIYGSLNPDYIEVIDADGACSFKGKVALSYTGDKKPYRKLPDGRCFDMGGWPMEDPEVVVAKPKRTRKAPAKKKTTTKKKAQDNINARHTFPTFWDRFKRSMVWNHSLG